MGDPLTAARHIREALAPDGTWMIVEPFAQDDPSGQPQPGRPRVLQLLDFLCLPNAHVAVRRLHARRAGGRGGDPPRGHRRRASPGSPGSPRRRSTSSTRPARRRSVGPGHRVAGARGRTGGRSRPCGLWSRRVGTVDRDGVRIAYEVFGEGEQTSCSPRSTRSSSRARGRPRCPGCPAARGWSRSIPGQRPVRPARRPRGVRQGDSRGRHARRDGRARRRRPPSWWGCAAPPGRRCWWPPRPPIAWTAWSPSPRGCRT